MTYEEFLNGKRQLSGQYGFGPTWMPSEAFDFQEYLIDWACRKGRAAIFADCGLGKTLMELAWAKNVSEKSGGRVLILTPLAVAHQTVSEGQKFGVEAVRSHSGELDGQIIVTNYERLHFFNPDDFAGVVCDESSILKNFDGVRKAAITEFMRMVKYRLLCTATAAPNDFIELGTSSEALGEMGHISMLQRFFKSMDGSYASGGGAQGRTRFSGEMSFGGKFRLKPHAQKDFWRWICSWARAVQKPSDLGFDDSRFQLPELITNQHVIKARNPNPEYLFEMPAVGLKEQRAERSRTVTERCELAAELANHDRPAILWCHLNSEGDLLEKLVKDCVQVSGRDSDEAKEEKFRAFESGEVRAMVSKPSVAGFGLNWQHCAHQTFFPSHSFEQWYQAIRRCWRFGQENPVTVDVISSEGERKVLSNLQRKSEAANLMFSNLVSHMRDELKIEEINEHTKNEKLPAWL